MGKRVSLLVGLLIDYIFYKMKHFAPQIYPLDIAKRH